MGAVPGRGGRPRRRPNLARRFFRCRVRGGGRSGSALPVRVGPRCAGATDDAVGPPPVFGSERAGAPRTARRRKPAPGTPAAHRHGRPPARRGGTGRCPGAAEGPSGRIAERCHDRPRRAVQRSEPCGRTASARDEDLYPSSRDVRLRAPRGRLSAPPEAPQAAECAALADAPPSPPYRGAASGTGASERAPCRVSLSGAPSRSEASPGGRPGRQRSRAPRGRLSAPPAAPQAAECGALADAPPSPAASRRSLRHHRVGAGTRAGRPPRRAVPPRGLPGPTSGPARSREPCGAACAGRGPTPGIMPPRRGAGRTAAVGGSVAGLPAPSRRERVRPGDGRRPACAARGFRPRVTANLSRMARA